MSVAGRVIQRLPLWVRSSPMDATLIALGIPSGLLSLFGVARSGALTELLPWWGPQLWAGALIVGCVAWLVGLTSIHEAEDGRLVIVRLPSLLLGLQVVSMATLTYGIVIILTTGWGGVAASVYMFTVAVGTWIRRVDLYTRYRGTS